MDSAVDLETEAAADELNINVGEKIAEQLNVRDDTALAQTSRCNVGRTEKKFRLGAGTALLAAAAFAPVSRGWRIGFAVVGIAELVTGAIRYCPVNQAFGIDTCRD